MDIEKNMLQIEDLLSGMSRDQLIALNRTIIRRIKTIDDLNRLKASLDLYPGDKVSWTDHQGFLHTGNILRINTKTVSVQEDNDNEGMWKISPSALKKINQ